MANLKNLFIFLFALKLAFLIGCSGVATYSKIPSMVGGSENADLEESNPDSSDIEVSIFLKNLSNVSDNSRVYIDIVPEGASGPVRSVEILVSYDVSRGRKGIPLFLKKGEKIDVQASLFDSVDPQKLLYEGNSGVLEISEFITYIDILMHEIRLVEKVDFIDSFDERRDVYPVIEKTLTKESNSLNGSFLIKFEAFVSHPANKNLTCNLSYQGPVGGLSIRSPEQIAQNGYCVSEIAITFEGIYDVTLEVSDGVFSTREIRRFEVSKMSMAIYVDTIPELSVNGPATAVRNSLVEFQFAIQDDGQNRCLFAEEDEIILEVYSSYDNYTLASSLTLYNNDCKGTIQMPDVISTLNYIFIFTDYYGNFDSAESTVTITN